MLPMPVDAIHVQQGGIQMTLLQHPVVLVNQESTRISLPLQCVGIVSLENSSRVKVAAPASLALPILGLKAAAEQYIASAMLAITICEAGL